MGKLVASPGSSLTAFLRKARLLNADPAPAVRAKLLTIEIFLMRNLGSTMSYFDRQN
jgi:hypothetical protein